MTQRLRLLSGLILFTYVTSHLLNHALGIISLQVAEAGRLIFIAVWRHPIGTILLYGGLLTHFTLVLWAVYQRRHLRIPRWEIVRLILGISIPPLLLQHAFGTRITHEASGIDDSYTRQVLAYWVMNPQLAVQQTALLLIAWTHGALGIHYWLRVKRWHAVTVPILSVLGPLIPLLALAGFANMGLEVQALAEDPGWLSQAFQVAPPEVAADVAWRRDAAMWTFVVAILLVFWARQVRTAVQRLGGVVRLTYPGGRQVQITPGTTVLEASRAAGIPHASLCGGRGRCSTCRTRIGAGLQSLPKPSTDEARVLRRIAAPPNVRLACQLRPTADLEVFPLLPPTGLLPDDLLRPGYSVGTEREIAILFADLRAFTRFAESRLPYDVVFVLNQYFAAVGGAIERSGGYLDKFIGDGVMALFGLESSPQEGCRAALRSAVEMARNLDSLNRGLANDLPEPLRIGIGIHAGHVIVGEMGHGRARALTAVGDAVNTASRLEELNKEYDSQLVLSEDVALRAAVDLAAFPRYEIELRGRTTPLAIRVIASARDLEPVLADSAASPIA
jgi:adenylate cyclase